MASKDEVEDLADLLDETLADFDRREAQTETASAESKPQEAGEEASYGEQWTEDFIQQMAREFEDNMRRLLAPQGGESAESNLADLNCGALLQGLLSGGEGNAMEPMMKGIVEQLLSKDLIYPSLKDIQKKFPGWIEVNGKGLSDDDLVNRKKQAEIIDEICRTYENDSLTDLQQRDKVFELMNELQTHGHPPEELIGGTDGPMASLFGGLNASADAASMPSLGGQQCAPM